MSASLRTGQTDDLTRAAMRVALDRRLSVMRPIPRRGLSRDDAAMYIGIGVTKFDEMVEDGRMPRPKRIDGRRVWDIVALDQHFDQLPDEDSPPRVANSWDDA